jgi:hypothetical protein
MDNNPIPLEEFVQSAVIQIMRAVKNSREEVKKLGGEINPHPDGDNKELIAAGMVRARGGGLMSYIEFDIAVTATKGQTRKSGVGVLFVSVGAGIEEKNDKNSETVSRISFRVPVRFQ